MDNPLEKAWNQASKIDRSTFAIRLLDVLQKTDSPEEHKFKKQQFPLCRPDPRANPDLLVLVINHCYTLADVAREIDTSVPTVQAWWNKGTPPLPRFRSRLYRLAKNPKSKATLTPEQAQKRLESILNAQPYQTRTQYERATQPDTAPLKVITPEDPEQDIPIDVDSQLPSKRMYSRGPRHLTRATRKPSKYVK